jgi:hypothetical protein
VTEPQPNVSNDLQRIRIFQVLRASVSYADGLSPAQRRLLGEFVLRLAHTAEGEDDAAHFPAQTAKASAAVFFLPETAQINLPAPLSPDLLGRVDLFLQEKNALQCEIAATIISNDNQPSNHARRALENLSRQQQKRIDALERQAEELRAGLAPLVPAPPASPLPADIAIRAREFRHDRQALQSQLVARLEDVRRTELNYRPGVELLNWSTNMSPNTFLPAGSYGTPTVPFGTMLRELPTQHTRPMEVLARLQQTTDRFVADTASRQKELEMRKVELVTATAEALYPSKFTGQPPSAESFAKAARALQADEAAERSAASLEQIAVTVRPGLTPAQRRLLFQGVLIDLDLPLPPGIRRPVSHFEAP